MYRGQNKPDGRGQTGAVRRALSDGRCQTGAVRRPLSDGRGQTPFAPRDARTLAEALTTSLAFGEKPPLALLLLKISSLGVESKPTPMALLRVFTVFTLALNREVMSTAMSAAAGSAVNTLTRHRADTSSPRDALDFP
ncbi:hypothetical protein EYF80_038521 [Liparis tanakae]|uniref:Uncharacterized protein n=1 Tax=Liparis tanakae TaxID=230148 RepID=A0A4Z2GDB9_9TELE|nr:hypothetical protein EYF80_038521 [Liparis tanakae]